MRTKAIVAGALITAILAIGCTGTTATQPTMGAVTSIANATTERIEQNTTTQPDRQTSSNGETNRQNSDDADLNRAGLTIKPTETGLDRNPIRLARSTDGQTGTIQVSATGFVEAAPDMAVISMAVNTKGLSVESARQETAATTQTIIEALKNQGIPEKDIQTHRFSIYPEYDYRDSYRYLTGYEVTHSLDVKVRDIQSAGRLIDSASQAGGNKLQFHNIRFDHQDPEGLMEDARYQAIEKMHQKAHQIATASGRELGPLLTVGEGIFIPIVRHRSISDSMADSALSSSAFDTSIPIGTGTVAVRVQGIFEMQ